MAIFIENGWQCAKSLWQSTVESLKGKFIFCFFKFNWTSWFFLKSLKLLTIKIFDDEVEKLTSKSPEKLSGYNNSLFL